MEIKTEIIINASVERIWSILADLENYKNWNPFIIESSGKPEVGGRIQNTMLNGTKTITFSPVIQKLEENRYFEWLGHLWIKGIFDGRHYFELRPLVNNQTLLVHGESFTGLLVKPIMKQISADTMNNFVKMNLALKSLAEGTVAEAV